MSGLAEMSALRGDLAEACADAASRLATADAVARLWDRDHTLWQNDPTEVSDRLGWLDGPEQAAAGAGRLAAFARRVEQAGLGEAILCGMGGSSLFPELLARTYPTGPHGSELDVLDTTHPAAVQRAVERVADGDTLVVVSSKSGTTIETRSHLAALWEAVGLGGHFAAITDAGSPLAELAAERGFRGVFEAPADVGGRFSALTEFGMLPAALLGLDVAALVGPAREMAAACRSAAANEGGAGLVDPASNPGLELATVLAAGARCGRDKLTVVLPPELTAFGDWLEQLVAESLGKTGTGLLPVVGEPLAEPDRYGDDRLFVSYDASVRSQLDRLSGAGHPVVAVEAGAPELFGEVVRWEVATALAGAALGINPFDQPDVASAKEATARALAGDLPPSETSGDVASTLAGVQAGDYVAIQAFVDPGDHALLERLGQARTAIRDRHRVAVTLGLGPRFLHSTGQYHKGGPDRGVFLQVFEPGPDGVDVEVPGEPYSFRQLFAAQAAGDLEALRSRGRRAERVTLDDLLATAT